MQFLVNKVIGSDNEQGSEETKIFPSVSDAYRYISTVNKHQKILAGNDEVTVTRLSDLLSERLTKVSVYTPIHPGTKYIITAF